MAFDRENFFKSCGHYGRGSAIADGFEALHAELAELRAACLGLKDRMERLAEAQADHIKRLDLRIDGIAIEADCAMDTPDAPARETGWAVVNYAGDPFSPEGFVFRRDVVDGYKAAIWFSGAGDARIFANALTYARKSTVRVACLYKDTLEEVGA